MTNKLIKKRFDECVDLSRELVRPHLRTYDEYMTQQEWEVAIILFKSILNQNE